MNKIDQKKLDSLLEVAYELRNREFKPPFSWADPPQGVLWLREKIARTILGMTNTPFGGDLIVGVEEGDKKGLSLTGVSDAQLESFQDFDGIKGFIDGFSSLATNFDIYWGEHKGQKYVVFTIQEFDEMPIVCRKNGQLAGVLTKDDIYARSKKAPYSTIKATDLEIREIVRMAADKEKSQLTGRGWKKADLLNPSQYYKKQVEDLK